MSKQDSVFRALADPTRRKIIHLLHTDGAHPVQGITSHFKMTRQAVTKHLKILADAKLVSMKKKGRESMYQLNTKPLESAMGWMMDHVQVHYNAERPADLDAYLEG